MRQTATGLKTGLLLDKLRHQIDEIDQEIFELLLRRQVLAQQIGEEKKRLGLDVMDIAREQEVMEGLVGRARPPLTPRSLRAIYTEIISAARSVQEPLKVSYLGPEGSFCHEAARELFGHSVRLFSHGTVEDIFSIVEKAQCDMGVVPIENSSQGSVGITLDLFYDYDLKIQAEIFIRIRHQLLSKEEAIDSVHTVYSHPMALSQCRTWLREHLPGVKILEATSTSEAACRASEGDGLGAIGSQMAAEVYGLKVLANGIEDRPGNITRFVAIGKNATKRAKENKTSILFSLPHKPGALSTAISPLARRGINMTRIESRPARAKPWEYLFFVDIEGHREDKVVREALWEIRQVCSYFKNLGSYPKGGEP